MDMKATSMMTLHALVITAILASMKLFGLIHHDWLVVVAPLIVIFALNALIVVGAIIVAAIVAIREK